MKQILLLCSAILLLSACEKEEWEDMEHNYYHGDIHIGEYVDGPSKVEELLDLGYNAIDGNLTIWGQYTPKRLSFLDQIYEVTGTVTIRDINPEKIFDNLIEVGEAIKIISVKEINDFPSLEKARSIHIRNSHFLSITAFNILEECDSILIYDHHGQVNDLDAFAALPEAEYLFLNLNQQTDFTFSGMENIARCNFLFLKNVGMNALPYLQQIDRMLIVSGTLGKDALASCQGVKMLGFDQAESLNNEIFGHPFACSTLIVEECRDILDLQWTSMIDSVYECTLNSNNMLISLDGLDLQNELRVVKAYSNDSLVDFCSIADLPLEKFKTWGNAYNPTLKTIQEGDCLMPEDTLTEEGLLW